MELRFRAWSIEKQSWIYFGLNNVPEWADLSEINMYAQKKDKNKKEIYKGDILKCYDGEMYLVDFDPDWGFTFKNTSRLARETSAYDLAQNFFFDIVEVCGNTFHNPELISELKEFYQTGLNEKQNTEEP